MDTRDHIPGAVFYINNMPNQTTLHTPSFLMYGFTPDTPTIFHTFNPKQATKTQRTQVDATTERFKLLAMVRAAIN